MREEIFNVPVTLEAICYCDYKQSEFIGNV